MRASIYNATGLDCGANVDRFHAGFAGTTADKLAPFLKYAQHACFLNRPGANQGRVSQVKPALNANFGCTRPAPTPIPFSLAPQLTRR